MTTDWQAGRIQLAFVETVEADWAAELLARVSDGHTLFVPRSLAQLVREVLEFANTAETSPTVQSDQIARMLLSINTEHNASELSPTGTASRETVERILNETFSLNSEQTIARLREALITEVASVLFDAPLKLEVLQGNTMDTWFREWPDRVIRSELGKTPADAFFVANGIPLGDLLKVGGYIVARMKSNNQLQFSRSELIAAGATESAVDYCILEMSAPIGSYRSNLRRDRRRGSIEQQRYTMTRFPFLRIADDTLLVLRYQWVADRFFGSMLYWPTFAGLPGFLPSGDAESGSVAESFSDGMNHIFERAVGDSLANIVANSTLATRLITEDELQQTWSTQRGAMPSACDWVIVAGRLCIVVDATNRHVSAELAQGLGTVDDYAADMEATFSNPGEKFDQLGKTMDRLADSGHADFGLGKDSVFAPLIVVPDGGLPNTPTSDLDMQLRSLPNLYRFDGRIYPPTAVTLSMLQLLEGVAERFGRHRFYPDVIEVINTWRRSNLTAVKMTLEDIVDGVFPPAPYRNAYSEDIAT
ncbi:hypothetical protein [Rhodococcus sp. ARC_M6]|uniref:hypothetical protein n=1 Tax=Rhodococcus sp. ARC_M6 TaxID=2928852 RepID=UPI001FB36C4C|nr:hypothetical protein [Rhodococcus sp. ARC_M6]MCJ0907462.1 hypothetical protein [Rhodococcus sp. ARC_M6]